ncbi:hypothetical protein TSUD_90220 [Trifolium subterraneum]|uniref:Uncharacterized protein n=1 Tax=Trifolium subterraneum TaxID=3900 RepID=A0A2Z6PP13_TRISU|nr:hypothetical protein TSUD_90220 [Trifolium subterraneum]
MENQSSTTSSSSMQFLILEQVQFMNVNDDSLLQWELVDVIDTEEEEQQVEKERTVVVDDDGDSFIWSVSSQIGDPIERINHRVLHLDAYVEDHNHHHNRQVNHDVVDDDEEDDGEDDDDDLDDELVPWNIGNKLGRQRMRKLGKRVSSKMHNSKRSPYLFVSPGCVRGKHGMGLKHCF